jgi:hypothetical protein
MQIKPGSIPFNSFDGSGPQEQSTDVTLDVDAFQATAILTGFNAAYSPSDDDHHLGNLEIRLRTQAVTPRIIRVTAVFGLRDWSGDWDDRYEGIINFAVIAE